MYIHPVQIILLLVITVMLMVARMAYATRRSQMANQTQGPEPEGLADIKGRVRVLERIVTDEEHSLSREIEQLRDR